MCDVLERSWCKRLQIRWIGYRLIKTDSCVFGLVFPGRIGATARGTCQNRTFCVAKPSVCL